MLEKVSDILETALVKEMNIDMADLEDFDEVVNETKDKLKILINNPHRDEKPLIYHLDVGAMYPNIMLTNRLQVSLIFMFNIAS